VWRDGGLELIDEIIFFFHFRKIPTPIGPVLLLTGRPQSCTGY
jgi:hypothetical protein